MLWASYDEPHRIERKKQTIQTARISKTTGGVLLVARQTECVILDPCMMPGLCRLPKWCYTYSERTVLINEKIVWSVLLEADNGSLKRETLMRIDKILGELAACWHYRLDRGGK